MPSYSPDAAAQAVSSITYGQTATTLTNTTLPCSGSPKTRVVQYTVQTGDSIADIIEIVLALININPYLYASTASVASPYTINVTSVIPGQAHTIALTETGTSLTISSTTVPTAASGVPNYGKIFTTNINASVSGDTDAYFQVSVDFQSFDGAQPTAASASGVVNLAPAKHANSIKALRAARGV